MPLSVRAGRHVVLHASLPSRSSDSVHSVAMIASFRNMRLSTFSHSDRLHMYKSNLMGNTYYNSFRYAVDGYYGHLCRFHTCPKPSKVSCASPYLPEALQRTVDLRRSIKVHHNEAKVHTHASHCNARSRFSNDNNISMLGSATLMGLPPA